MKYVAMMLSLICVLVLAVSAEAVTLNWDASVPDATHDAATGYKVYKGLNATCNQAGPLTWLIQTLGNVLTTTDTVTAGDTACYEVTGTNSGGESVHSARVSILVSNPPAAPVNLRVVQ